MSPAERVSTARIASPDRPLSSFLESSTPVYMAGAIIGISVAFLLILGLLPLLR